MQAIAGESSHPVLLTFTSLAYAGDDPSKPSCDDGHWFYITPSGGRIHATPDNTTIKDGHWFDEAPAVDGVGHYTKDQYGNYIEYPIEAATPSANTTTVTSSNDEDNSTA